MDKLSTPNAASSPVPSDSGGGETKHDSFLEDVGLLPGGNCWLSERNVTKRSESPITSSPFSSILSKDELEEKNNREFIESKENKKKRHSDQSLTNFISTSSSSSSLRREIGSGDRFYREDKQQQQQQQVDKILGKSRYSDSAKNFENRNKILHNNDRSKLNVDKKSSSARRSAGYKDKEQSLEASDDRKQASVRTKQSLLVVSEVNRDQQRRSDTGDKNSKDISDSVALLSAIKDIVSTYTKEESIKITKMMNELHILSQASILKNFIFQTDEIKKVNGNNGDYRKILEDNKILRENYEILKLRYENLLKELEDSEKVREENNELRLRIQELLAKTSS